MPNQVGKTTAMCTMARAEWSGTWPRYFGRPTTPRSRLRGRRILIVAETMDHLRKDVVPKLEEIIPEHLLARPPRTEDGVKIEFPSIWGSTIQLMSYKQDRRIFEGWQSDVAFFNEPPRQDIFTAVIRGQTKRRGRVCMGFTPVAPEENNRPMHDITWVRDDLLEPAQRPGSPLYGDVKIFDNIDAHANCIQCSGGVIEHDEIEKWIALLPEHEKVARVYGQWSDSIGITYGYVKRDIHVVHDFEVPPGWPIVLVVDPHPKKGIYGVVAVVDPEDDWFIAHAFVVADNAFSIMCKDMRAHLENPKLPHLPDKYVMDQRGGKTRINMETQEDWFRAFAREGFPFAPSRDVEHETLHEWLRPTWRRSDGQELQTPKLRLFRSVAQMEKGPLWALETYCYQPEASQQVQARAKGKDWIDCLRYLSGQPGLSWEKLRRLREPMDMPGPGRLVESYVPRLGRGPDRAARPHLFVGRRRPSMARSYTGTGMHPARFRIP